MNLKKRIALFAAFCLFLAGCSSTTAGSEASSVSPVTEAPEETAAIATAEAAQIITPLPDNTMDNLTDAILSVSLEEGRAYVDDTGKMQMDVTIYSYDRYDMVDISILKVGDTLVTHTGEVEVLTLEQDAYGTVRINGGLDEGGLDLATDDSGVFYESGFNDHKSWYKVGEATIRVSVDFLFTDSADPDQGEIIYYPGSFLIGEVTNYDFTPYNTTIRVEAGQIVEMHRRYIP